MSATGQAGYLDRCICDWPPAADSAHRVPIDCNTAERREAARQYAEHAPAREAEAARVRTINRATWIIEKLGRASEEPIEKLLGEIYDEHQADRERAL